jgi:hypothetical protein
VSQELPQVSWDMRRQTLACSEALLRILHVALDTYGDDMESFIIYLAVSCANVSGSLRDPQLAASPPPPGPMDPGLLRPVSRRAIAASTGLSRETVRRKIATFLARGVLVETGAGVRIQDHLLEDPRNFGFAEAMIREFGRTGTSLPTPPT